MTGLRESDIQDDPLATLDQVDVAILVLCRSPCWPGAGSAHSQQHHPVLPQPELQHLTTWGSVEYLCHFHAQAQVFLLENKDEHGVR